MKIEALKEDYILELEMLYDEDEAKVLLEMAIEHITGMPYRKLLLLPEDQRLNPIQVQQLLSVLNDLKIGKPIQHILGEAHFYGSVFKVNENVLIPRPETEELVDWIINNHAGSSTKNKSVLDIGTGSGCIPISIKKYLPAFLVSTMDVSPQALDMARENAAQLKTDINFINADILNYTTEDKFDVIVSNPPYIRELEKKQMHNNVLLHEPHLALFVSNEEPLVFYKAIADFAKKQLHHGGLLYFEINEYLGRETVDMLLAKGFSDIELKADMQGKDRMIKAVRV
ncbi:peptide chain release factor N(5)-glutamine methyltransferase [Pedobacter sp. BMA]|uniref:peptide chain release factor N(5)-glutamine methyltransferase n=1 Tax=Pedobacter sp. BMA TaxID=1663685 RepID=UPI00064B4F2C|nr:peptide chain release factor N(5)-glutamine methyltransferase [Pedobacter sp. BMA]KLT64168.1 hypothetical protein AB669_16460 [Pedobacter sp. BMA]